MSYIGLKIKTLREKKEITAKDLAVAIGRKGKSPQQYIYDIENGKTESVKASVLYKIAGVLGVEYKEFFEFLDDNEKSEIKMVAEADLNPEYNKNNDNNWKEKYYEALEEINRLQKELIEVKSNTTR